MKPDTGPLDARAGAWRWRTFWQATPLSRVGSIIVLGIVGAIIALEIVLAATGVTGEPLGTTVAQILVTACFALFAVRPPVAALALLAGASLALGRGGADQTLLALAVATGLVVATCSPILATLYVVGIGGWVLTVEMLSDAPRSPGWLIVLFFVTLTSALVGYFVRRLRERTRSLASALAAQEAKAAAVAQAERRRISDELHDFIAHELTIIVMQASVLEQTSDADTAERSREAIKTSARQALADIRRVLELAAEAPSVDADTSHPERRRLLPTYTEIERELGAAGIRVEATGLDAAAGLSPTVDATLARVLREASTNVVKHAGPTDTVEVRLSSDDQDVVFSVLNSAAARGMLADLALPSGGYGLTRLRERVRALSGSFSARSTDEGWIVETRLPRR